jgi:hypothetical protein
MVPVWTGISLKCAIYVGRVTIVHGNPDPPINQAPGHRAFPVAIDEPCCASFFHPPGGYFPGLMEIVPQLEWFGYGNY